LFLQFYDLAIEWSYSHAIADHVVAGGRMQLP